MPGWRESSPTHSKFSEADSSISSEHGREFPSHKRPSRRLLQESHHQFVIALSHYHEKMLEPAKERFWLQPASVTADKSYSLLRLKNRKNEARASSECQGKRYAPPRILNQVLFD